MSDVRGQNDDAADLVSAVEYLCQWPTGRVHLTAIHPDKPGIIARSFDKDDKGREAMTAWLRRAVAKGFGCYANYNDLRIVLKPSVKAKEIDVSQLVAFHVDADVDKSITDPTKFEIAKADLLERIQRAGKPPTHIVDSGNGFGIFWLLDKPIKVAPQNLDSLKAINIGLRNAFEGDKCQDLCHVLRVPGTINFPNEGKRKRNRPISPTRVILADEFSPYALADFAEFAEAAPQPEPKVENEAIDIPDKVDLSILDVEFRKLIEQGPGNVKYGDGSRSSFTYYVAAHLREDYGFTDGEIVSVIITPGYAASEHVLSQTQRGPDPVPQAMRIIADLNKRGIKRGAVSAQEDFAADPVEPEKVAEEVKAEQSKRRPQVMIDLAHLPRMVRQTQDNLIADSKHEDAPTSDQIFQRGGELVHLSRNKLKPRKPGEMVDRAFHVRDDLLLQPVTDGWLTDRTMRAMDYYKVVDDVAILCPVPMKVITTLGKINTSWKFPKLTATVESPTLRPDGSVLEKFGYDPRSGLYLDTGGVDFPPIKERPTKADAEAALAILAEPLVDFPFRDDDGYKGFSRSVKHAAMLTAVVRRSLPTAPTFGYDANEVESGKTMCAQVDAIMATGRRTGERPFTNDPEEQRKAIGSALLAADSVILYDNVDVPIEGATLCGVVTDETFKDRKLGEHGQITAPTCALILFTGNHLVAAGDMTARVLICKLVPDKSLAERKFTHAPLDEYLIRNRPALVTAALTIMRAYLVAGRPMPGSTSRFPEWRAVVADALVWLGQPDPCLAFGRAAKEDPTRQNFAAVLRPWIKEASLKGWRTTAQVIERPNIALAIADAAGIDMNRLTGRRATEYLKSMVGVNVGGWRLEQRGGTLKEALVWQLVEAD